MLYKTCSWNNRGFFIVLKDLNVSILLDFYANVLTDKQREVVELYYNEDLSLSEIAQHVGISRQGVRDSIKRGEAVLFDLEEKLGFAQRFNKLRSGIISITKDVNEIEYHNDKYCFSREISDSVHNIKKISEQLLD